MIETIGWTGLVLSILCFIVFVVITGVGLYTQLKNVTVPANAATAIAAGGAHFAPAAAPSVPELTELFKALATVIDSVVKAGPSLAGLAASMVFLGIAAFTATQGVKAEPPRCSIAKEAVAKIKDPSSAVDAIPVICEPASGRATKP